MPRTQIRCSGYSCRSRHSHPLLLCKLNILHRCVGFFGGIAAIFLAWHSSWTERPSSSVLDFLSSIGWKQIEHNHSRIMGEFPLRWEYRYRRFTTRSHKILLKFRRWIDTLCSSRGDRSKTLLRPSECYGDVSTAITQSKESLDSSDSCCPPKQAKKTAGFWWRMADQFSFQW